MPLWWWQSARQLSGSSAAWRPSVCSSSRQGTGQWSAMVAVAVQPAGHWQVWLARARTVGRVWLRHSGECQMVFWVRRDRYVLVAGIWS